MTLSSFTIDRATWLNGYVLEGLGYAEHGSLLATFKIEGARRAMRCCLGFASQACGIADEHMGNTGNPSDMDIPEIEKLPSFLIEKSKTDVFFHFSDSDIAHNLMKINDDRVIDLKERELRIAEIFKENGVEVTFVGEYPRFE